MCFKVK
jgi:apoptosis-inducing factor 3